MAVTGATAKRSLYFLRSSPATYHNTITFTMTFPGIEWQVKRRALQQVGQLGSRDAHLLQEDCVVALKSLKNIMIRAPHAEAIH